jgi:uncharacterized protein (TIGR02301 family)
MMRRALVVLLTGLLLAPPVRAQERSPAERQALVDLAFVLGESQQLRQTCNGASDVYWRSRMRALEQAEQADAPFTRRLVDSYNDGFKLEQQRFPTCNGSSRQEAERVAAKGRELSVTLSGSVADEATTR